jgi:hypothetical protein
MNPRIPCFFGVLPVAKLVHKRGERVGVKVLRVPKVPRSIRLTR